MSFWQRVSFWLPKPLVYFATIRLTAWATGGDYGTTIVPELTAMEALRRWEKHYDKGFASPYSRVSNVKNC